MCFGYDKFFAGQKAMHGFELYHHISMFLSEHPHVRSIVELGTSKGAMSIYLGLWGVRLGIPVHTFDIFPQPMGPLDGIVGTGKPIFDALHIQTHWVDFTTPEGRHQVVQAIGTQPTYLYVDGGNKAWEFDTFVPLVAPGSIISVHDFFNHPEIGEIKSTDIEKTIREKGLNLEPWHQEIWSEVALGFWAKR